MPTPMETVGAAAAHIAAGRVQEGARLAYEAAFPSCRRCGAAAWPALQDDRGRPEIRLLAGGPAY